MMVNRTVFNVKKGRTAEVLELLEGIWEQHPPPHNHRAYTPLFGTRDQLVIEAEWESFDEYETWWAQFRSSEEVGPFWEKWLKNSKAGGSNEMWELRLSS